MVQEFCQSRRATCTVRYQGSLDIALALKPGNDPEADAVWPAASIWIDMFDTARRVKSVKSIAQMPVILGVRRSKAQALGWIGAKVTTRDILAAVEGGRLKFLMTSATQSNSGAAAYLAMLAAGIGKPDLIEAGDLDKSEVLATVRGLLRGVERSSGSSGWLADLYREGERTGAQYQAIWNYEAVIKETNDKLVADRKEPLYAIYPEDGVSVGDSPLGFVDRGRGKEVESFFNDLQGFLLKSETQARIAATGRLFDDYVAGGAGAQPLIVGYENQLIEWVLQDADRWKRVEANAPSKPVILYPRPTAFSAHPLISVDRAADELIDALLSESLLELAWEEHGFRGPLGTIGKARNTLLQSRLIERIDAVLPMPDAPVMLALLDRLATA